MRETLEYLFEQKTLTRKQAHASLAQISVGDVEETQIAAFLAAFQMRGITVEELAGFRDALLELCYHVNLSDFDPVDLCGSGGDTKNTFNISTLASLVTAGAGVNVAKHGNYGVSSICGSSNVLEQFGLRFANDEDQLKRQLDASGICVMHAPLFHPAMKAVAPVRKSLGIRTFFNMLGPLVNPSKPKRQLVGVYSLELQRYYQYLFQEKNSEYRIVHSLDGYDELSLTGEAKVVSPDEERLISPVDMNLPEVSMESISGGNTISQATYIFRKILRGEGTKEQNAVVCANSALAIQCAKPETSLEDAVGMATESLRNGSAKNALIKLLAA